MPFLRRRAAQASESDMRRHTLLPDTLALPGKHPPRPPSRTSSAVELPSSASALSPDPVSCSNGANPSIPAPPVTPPSDDSPSSSRQGPKPSIDDPIDRPDSPPIQEETPKHRRFSMLRFRNASDSQLSTRAKKHAQEAEEPLPPLPRPPEIITTAPTVDFNGPSKKPSRMKLSARLRRSGEEPRPDLSAFPFSTKQHDTTERRRPKPPSHTASTASKQSITIEEPPHPRASGSSRENGEYQRTSLGLPMNRSSESSSHIPEIQPFACHGTIPVGFEELGPFISHEVTFAPAGAIFDDEFSGADVNGGSTCSTHYANIFIYRSEKLWQGSLTPATPGSNASKNNSLQLPRESVVLPERREDENPAKYLDRLEEVVSRSVIASALSKNTDAFSHAVMRSYMRRFSFFEDPMDMALRKLLMEAELPKETQQIDRFLQAFANRYHECNPGIYSSPDQAYFIAFSLLILHTDVFNKNNKHKMQKTDYIKNTRGEGIFDEILEVFYDNITYTPFIHVEDDLDINGERIVAHKTKKSIFPNGNNPEAALKKAAKEPIDPYTLILENRLDILRPNLKDVMQIDDHYSYLGTANNLNLKELQKTFFRTGILQIVSARSRPDAFMSDKTTSNPEEAQPGVVDIKITKVGLLWRKDTKKKKTRSPWQEWGAILTGAQLYFFRNVAWVKNLMHQYETHIKLGHDGIPIIFKPPLDQFKPDALISTDGAVALLDSTYKKHKHAFVYVRHGGFEEVLLADDEDEMNDWLAKLNYAAAFRTSGVRMRGVVGGTYDGQGRRAIRRLDSESIVTATGEVTVARSRIDQKMAQDILAARREIMWQKVNEANERLQLEEKKLDSELRNARHLQILAPIQPKTREQMLLSAARMAAQLKWIRIEIWKTKCHRDILAMDLDEERELMGLPADGSRESLSPEKASLGREESNGSGAVPKAPRSPMQLSLKRNSVAAGQSDVDSPVTDVFQTPPTSATSATFHKQQNSWELPPLVLDHETFRKASVSSAMSSNPSITATPPRKIASSSSAPEPGKVDEHPEVDADERDLLQQTGLVDSHDSHGTDTKAPAPAVEPDEPHGERRERHPHRASADRPDRSKIRRSLQRTLREGAGHLSHARSKKGKEPISGGLADDAAQEPDVLTRGSGSFVVHGKKASVITFGSELQNMSPDERLRARKAAQAAAFGGETSSTSTSAIPDYRSVLQSHRGPDERRESTASTSTMTAKSFHELHRKYSSAQAARAAALGGNLAVPSDEDSDAAVSFSDGRRTPLPVIETEDVDEEDEDGAGVAGRALRDSETSDEDDDLSSPPLTSRQAQFFTPEPPASPTSGSAREGDGESTGEGKDDISSPPLQAVVGA
ncbi:Protein transport protein sec73 [Pleurostoma richardsiae]|uniref:Protein transport protein sec73 n=1 Tax=Pleurostoma richardsiae TaxID=41990 RepID=A0AA38VRL6_9PEZI|nr:Protein transport protein sec73 [Pleurostoma richardsiae]